MSLRVWLPLNGDLRNNGLDKLINASVQSGCSVSSDGKIGKCYKNTGTTAAVATPISFSADKFSLCAWVRIDSRHSDWCRSVGLSGNGTYMGLCCEHTNGSSLGFHYYKTIDGTNTSVFDIYPLNSEEGIWIHFCMIYDGIKYYIYKNGSLLTSANANKQNIKAEMTTLYLFGGINGRYSLSSLNDVRLYDHALSAKEVKELSKGLVAHYPLNNNAGQENLFNWGNKGNEIITLNNYQNTGSFTQFSNCLTFDAKDTVGTTYTISFWAKSPNGTTSLLLYNNNSTPRYFYFSPTTLTTNLGNEWQYFTYTFTNQDRGSGTTTASVCNRIEIYMPSKMGGQVKLIKIEEGNKATIWSPAPSDTYYNKLGYDKNIIYDTSGNGYNMIINGNPTCSTNTPRNSTCTKFVTPSNAYCTKFSPTGYTNSYSIAFWAVYTNNGMAFAHANGNRLNLWFNSGKILWNTGDGGNNPFQNNGTDISNSAYLNSWNHYVITADGTSNKLYIDGEYVGTAKTFKPLTGTTLVLSGWSTDTSTSYRLNSSMSDFRLYSTALSEEDIKELYNVGASIDKEGNVFAYEFKED